MPNGRSRPCRQSSFGVILTGYGLITPDAMYQQSLGINMNFRWGLVLLAFGAIMLTLALRARSRTPST